MYKKYTINFQGDETVLYVKYELQQSFEKIPTIFTYAKMALADYAVDVKTKKVVKSPSDNEVDFIKSVNN